MAGRSKGVSIEEKIEKAKSLVEKRQAAFDKAKKSLDDAKVKLKDLEEKKGAAEKEKIVDLIMNSDKSYDDIKEFLLGQDK